jgi:Holliday junction resolvasome RuvABC endonuclease subunit
MVILSIDPSLSCTGWALTHNIDGASIFLLNSGEFVTDPNSALQYRYRAIYQHFEGLILKYSPEILLVEDVYLRMNPNTGLKLSLVQGIILSLCISFGLKYRRMHANTARKHVRVIYTDFTMKDGKMLAKKLFTYVFHIDPQSEHVADAGLLAIAYNCIHNTVRP